MWASGHDLWSPNFVCGCVAALESSPEAAIAAASCTWIDADGNVIEKESGCYDTRGLGSLRRFFFAFWGNLHPVLGLIRMEYLRNVPKIHECVGADQILLTDLALRGDFLHVPEASWCRRQPRQEESHRDKIERYTGSEFQFGGNWIDRRMPLMRLPIEQLKIVVRSRLRLLDKIVLITAILPAFALRYLDGRRS